MRRGLYEIVKGLLGYCIGIFPLFCKIFKLLIPLIESIDILFKREPTFNSGYATF